MKTKLVLLFALMALMFISCTPNQIDVKVANATYKDLIKLEPKVKCAGPCDEYDELQEGAMEEDGTMRGHARQDGNAGRSYVRMEFNEETQKAVMYASAGGYVENINSVITGGDSYKFDRYPLNFGARVRTEEIQEGELDMYANELKHHYGFTLYSFDEVAESESGTKGYDVDFHLYPEGEFIHYQVVIGESKLWNRGATFRFKDWKAAKAKFDVLYKEMQRLEKLQDD